MSTQGADGGRILYPLAMRLIDVQPGFDYTVSITLPQDELPSGVYTISVDILDPVTREAGIALAMAAVENDLRYKLMRIGLRQ